MSRCCCNCCCCCRSLNFVRAAAGVAQLRGVGWICSLAWVDRQATWLGFYAAAALSIRGLVHIYQFVARCHAFIFTAVARL